MEILYDDNYITVCVKEPMMLSEKSSTGNDIISALDEYYNQSGQSANAYPIHRLDFGVGGVMVFAKSHEAAAKMSALIADGALEKEYLAVVSGRPQEENGIYEDLLFKDSKKNKSFVVKRKRAGVRDAKLAYKVIDSETIDGEAFSLVRIKLYTGRSHQIRVQFSSSNMPLYGDRKYGSKTGNDIALWSFRLVIMHPKTRERMEFSKLPEADIFTCFKMPV